MSSKSRELQSQGIDVINLSIGEPDFDTPEFIKEAARQAIADNFTHYTAVPAAQDVREAISKKFKRDNQLDYAPSQIVVSTGAKQSLMNVVMSLIDPGDEVLLPAPYWVSYFEMIRMAEGTPVVLPTSIAVDYKITPEQLREAITPKSRMFLFSSPCNPSGSVYTEAELAALVAVLAEHPNIMVVSDEIYEHINFLGKHTSIGQFDALRDRVITVNGVSKGFAMTGWRVGYIGAPQWVADACVKLQGQFTSATCSIAQKAAKAAVEADPEVTESMRLAFANRRKLVYDLLSQVPGIQLNDPKGAFYFFPDVSHYFGMSFEDVVINDAGDLAMYLLNEAHVAVVTGDAFGNPECVRISYATSEDNLKEAVRRIAAALQKLERA
jgi:aspartate aminotransferase